MQLPNWTQPNRWMTKLRYSCYWLPLRRFAPTNKVIAGMAASLQIRENRKRVQSNKVHLLSNQINQMRMKSNEGAYPTMAKESWTTKRGALSRTNSFRNWGTTPIIKPTVCIERRKEELSLLGRTKKVPICCNLIVISSTSLSWF